MEKFGWRRGLVTGTGLLLLALPLSALAGQTAAGAAPPPPPPAHSPYWTIEDLGDACTTAYSINNADQIAGIYDSDSGGDVGCEEPVLGPNTANSSGPAEATSEATEWQGHNTNTITPTGLFPATGDTGAIAVGINSSGQVVGTSLPSVTPVLFDSSGANSATPLVQPPGSAGSIPAADDDAGTAVGESLVGGVTVGAEFSLSGAPAVTLNAVPGYPGGSTAAAVSSNGSWSVGESMFDSSGTRTEATEWNLTAGGASAVDLGDNPSASSATNIESFADGVTNTGFAVGGEQDEFGSGSGATYDLNATEYMGGEGRILENAPGDDASQATAVDNEEVAVGYSGNIDQSNPAEVPMPDQAAVEWTPLGEVVNLNAELPPNSGWNLQIATGINDDGEIIGMGLYNGVENAFQLIPPPIVSSVSPADGPAAGGTSVTISGANFEGATAVDFGTTPATNVDVVSPNEITATAPAGSGTVDVTVTQSSAEPTTTSATSAADQFIYEPTAPPGTTGSATGVSTSPTGSATATEGGITVTAQGEGAVTAATYSSDPTSSSPSSPSGQYFDVDVSPGNTFTSLTIADCNGAGANTLQWFNPAANAGQGAFEPVVGNPGPTLTPASGSSPACVTVTLTQSTSPTIADMTGTVFAGEEPLKTTLKAAPALVQLESLSLELFTLSATLTDSAGPVAGQTVVFTAGSTTICSAKTAANGTATCPGLASILSIVLGLGYTATYAGTSAYAPSSARGSLIG